MKIDGINIFNKTDDKTEFQQRTEINEKEQNGNCRTESYSN